ncbi:hypothetical protein ACQ4PT_044936 [Festuca glaucescens]
MEIKVLSSKLVKPAHDGGAGAAAPVPEYVPLSVFDRVAYQMPMTIFCFAAPAPSTADIQKGLVAALTRYRAFAGQLGEGPDGTPAVVLNDHGARLVEAAVLDADIADMAGEPTPELLKLHPYLELELEEVVVVQLTRFRCGSLTVGFTSNHVVADGHATSDFLVAWGRATRGLPPMDICPVYHREELFRPRSPPLLEYDHRTREYYRPDPPAKTSAVGYDAYGTRSIVIHKAHLTKDFIVALRAKASQGGVPFSRFETIVAHVWRAMTRARGLGNGDPRQASTIRISIDGRRRLGAAAPAGYFGNLVLWAFPRATVGDLLSQPLKHAAQVIHDEVARVADAAYFQSFVDFACSGAVEEEGLAPSSVLKDVLCPDMEVDSWLTFPFYELDFGTGRPSWLTPSYFTSEGTLYLAPSNVGDGSVDAFVHVFQHNLHAFKQCCYSMD